MRFYFPIVRRDLPGRDTQDWTEVIDGEKRLIIRVGTGFTDKETARIVAQIVRLYEDGEKPILPLPPPAPHPHGHSAALSSTAATVAVILAAAGLAVYYTHPHNNPHIDGQVTRQAPAAIPPAHTRKPRHTPAPTLTGGLPAPTPSPITTDTPIPIPDLTRSIQAVTGDHPIRHAIGPHPLRDAVTPAGRHPIRHLLSSPPCPPKHPSRSMPKLPCLPFQAGCGSG